MKKFTSILMLLAGWLCAFSAWADGEVTFTVASSYTDANSLEDGYYVIKSRCKGDNGYMYHESTATNRPFRHFLEADGMLDNIDTKYVWKLTKQSDGSFTLRNFASQAYVPAHNGNGGNMEDATTEGSAAKLKPQSFTAYDNSLAGGVLLYETNYTNGSNNIFIHVNTPNENATTGYKHNYSFWTGGEVGDGKSIAQFAFYKATTTAEIVEVSYTLKLDEQAIETVTMDATPGSTATIPTFDTEMSYYYSKAFAEGTNTTISSTNKEFTVVATEGAKPFEHDKFYTSYFRGDQSRYAVYVSDSQVSTGSTVTSWANLKNGTWQFKQSGYGVKVYNVAQKKYVKVANGNNQTLASMTASEDEASVFTVLQNSTGGFTLKLQGTNYAALGDHISSKLGIWNPGATNSYNDGGSNWALTEVTLESAKTLLKNEITNATVGDAHNSEGLLQYVTTEADKTAATSKVDGVETLQALYDLELSMASFRPEEGAYYQIYTKFRTPGYISSASIQVNTSGSLDQSFDSSNNRRILRTTEGTGVGIVPQLWQFEKSDNDGYYYVKNANVGLYWGSMSDYAAAIEMPLQKNWSGTFRLIVGKDNVATQAAFVQSDNHMVNAYGGNNNNILADWNGNSTGDEGSNWCIKKVTEIPVTISEVGYTSIALPFAVEIPSESGVKAYYGTKVADSYLTLTELEGNVIPANTGVILGKDGGTTVSLKITTTDTQASESNLLKPATAKRAGFTTETTYGLAKGSNNKAAFLLNTLTYIPANKAYLLASDATGTSSDPAAAPATLSFSFGGDQTGIDSAIATDGQNDEQFFDLQGRRVLFPANGIFVTKSGKKVLFK